MYMPGPDPATGYCAVPPSPMDLGQEPTFINEAEGPSAHRLPNFRALTSPYPIVFPENARVTLITTINSYLCALDVSSKHSYR
ncbi:hypothetical protein BLAT2472_60049 [Burkholderia latens]